MTDPIIDHENPDVCRLSIKFVAWILLVSFVSGSLWAQQIAPRNARELLELHGIDASQLERFQDHEPIGPADEETLIRILQRFPRFPQHRLQQWSQPQLKDWSAFTAAPNEHRVAVFRLTGRATHVERSALLPEIARRLEFAEYFRVTMRLNSDSQQSAIVCTRRVPKAWLTSGPIDEPAGAVALFLKPGANMDGSTQLVFVGERMAWFPDQPGAGSGITPDHVFLASLGFDVGLFDQVKEGNKRPLSLADREGFYQLLAAVRTADRDEFRERSKPLEMVPLLREPTMHHGELLTVEGIARRVIKVRVDDADVRERFGLDHYYQIDLFVDLDKQVIKLGKDESGQKAAVFENSFPVTVCVPTLPPGFPEGDRVRENVRVQAAFYKLWSYSSEYVSSIDKQLSQISPMLIGIEPRLTPTEPFDSGIGYLLAALTVLLLVGILYSLWRTKNRFGRPPDRMSAVEANEGTAEDAGRELPERPDFGNLS
jgi:hypothetical protein